MLTSKERAYLRGLANGITPIFQVGKDGIGKNFVKQVYDALEARELIKITVLENAMSETRAVCDEIVAKVGCEPVQVIGNKIVLYRESRKNKQIDLKDANRKK